MKKLFLLFLMALAGLTHADKRKAIVFCEPSQFFQGDAVSAPLSASNGDNTLYYSRFLSQTVATMAAATGVTMVVNIMAPTSIKFGRNATIGLTVTYGGVTDSAALSATAKVQITSYADANGLTTNAIQVLAPIALTNALQYGTPFDVDLGEVTGVNPGDTIAVHVTRSLGSNQVLHIWRAYAKFEPSGGFWPF